MKMEFKEPLIKLLNFREKRNIYVYTYTNSQIQYIGNCGRVPAYIPGSPFTGTFSEWHTFYGDHSVVYYGKTGNKIEYEPVYSYNLLDEANKHRETSNEALFQESQKQWASLYGADVSEVISIGWEAFVSKALK